MIAEYLEHALQFEQMAAQASDPALKASLTNQAEAYRKLATERAEGLPVSIPPEGPGRRGPALVGADNTMIATGRVTWFDLDKKFGFIQLDGVEHGDAFLHVSVLKAAGYVSVPAGTTIRVRVEHQHGRRRVSEILQVDTTTALAGEAAAVKRKNAE